MKTRFTDRYEQGLQQIKDSLGKKSGIKKLPLVSERIGRLKAKYSSTHRYYDIQLKTDINGNVSEMT